MAEAVKVMVRCRPMNAKQKQRGCISVIDIDGKNNQVNLVKEDRKQQPKSFSFDFVFGVDSAQSLIYEQSAFSLVDNVLDGYNGTIFAYGQTGCGKTHTMMGLNTNDESRGIIPRTFSQIITVTKNDTSKTHLIRCSFMEIYNQEIHDLLSKDTQAKMDIHSSPDKGVFVKDLTQIKVDNIQKMQQYMEIGFSKRATRKTNMNDSSSRSHSIFTIFIDSQQTDEKGNEKYKASKLNLVDLAGSQRSSKTGATGEGMKEANKINLSLSALGNVISALVDGKIHHIPYRDSKLTRLLEDSLGGNTKTIMIAAVSPANYNYDETLSTLRYASRAKFIQNKPKVNEDPKDTLLKQYMEEIKKLKMMLQGKMPIIPQAIQQGGGGNGEVVYQQRIVYRQGDNKENNTLEEELKSKEMMLRNQQEQKQILRQKLLALQTNFDRKGPDREDEKEMEKLKKLKEKIKIQKKKEQEYKKQKQRREEQLLSIEKNYKNLNQEVDEMRQRFKQIKKKYTANLVELRDIQDEHEDQKEELLDTIRYQQKQVKKFQAILSIMMNQDQIDLVINNSEWSQQRRQWIVPTFSYRERTVNFPKVGGKTKEMIDQEREKKEVYFKDSGSSGSKKDLEKRSSYEGFKVNSIVKGAREDNFGYSMNSIPSSQLLRPNIPQSKTTQLTPLKNDSIQKARTEMLLYPQDKKRKNMDRLDPIQLSPESRKYY